MGYQCLCMSVSPETEEDRRGLYRAPGAKVSMGTRHQKASSEQCNEFLLEPFEESVCITYQARSLGPLIASSGNEPGS